MKRIRSYLFVFTVAAGLLLAAVPARAWSGLPEPSGEARSWSPLTWFLETLADFWSFWTADGGDGDLSELSKDQPRGPNSGGNQAPPPPPLPPGGGCIDPNGCK